MDKYDEPHMIEYELTDTKLIFQLRNIIRLKRHHYMPQTSQKSTKLGYELGENLVIDHGIKNTNKFAV